MHNATSVSLLYRVRNQTDSGSWEEFAELYYSMVHRWLRSQGVSSHDADDVVQDVMSYVCREIGNFDHNGRRGAFRHWLRRIMVNRLHEHFRKRNRRGGDAADLGELAGQLADGRSGVSRVWRQEHDRCVLEHLLSTVGSRFQEKSLDAFRGVALEQRPAEEVADELGMTVGTVRVAQCRVLRALREIGEGWID